MSNFVILTDSSCDLSHEMAEQLGLHVVPLTVSSPKGDFKNYLDHREVDVETFYGYLRAGDMCKTSAINTEQWTEAMEEIIKSGKDVLCLAFSSGLSGTYSASAIAAQDLSEKYPERKVYSVDTLCASLGQGLLVDLTVQEQRKGKTIEEVRDFCEGIKGKIHHWVTVGNLTQLKRGGRLTAAKAFFGSLLHVKPIIHVDSKGRLVAVDTIKGRKKAINHLVEQMGEMIVAPEGQRCYIVNSDCTPEAEALAEVLKEKFPISEVVIGDIGPVIGSHTGKDTIAVFFQGQERTSED